MRATAIAFVLASLIGAAPSARAAQVEPRVKLLVRDRPSTSARIVDRVPAGHKLPLLGRTPDGMWAHVQGARRDGWVPSGQLKGKQPRGGADDEAEASADDEENRKPLASKKGVRPEAWVSSSRYHDGEDSKLTVAANKAELYGRPASGGAVLGIVRRGEVVHLVRKSQDKRWCLVDVGGGEVAWLESKYVRPGAFRAPVSNDEPSDPPPPPPRARREAPVQEVAEREPDPEPAPPPPPPPAPTRKSKRAERVEREAPPAAEPPEERPSRNSDDETPPGIAAAPVEKPSKKKGKKPVRLASRGGSDVGIPSGSSETTVEKSLPASSGSQNAYAAEVSGGIAILGSRFTSNGTGLLTNYESSTSAIGIKLAVGYGRSIGKYLRLGLDGSYTFAGAAGVKYMFSDGGSVQLGVQSHVLDGGVSGGVHLDVLGGLDLGLRLGFELALNLIAPSLKAPLPSDRILGMTIGVGVAAPNLFHIAGRPLGLRLYGGGLVPADRAQTVGLEDGATSTTVGGFFGGGLTYGLFTPSPAKKYNGQLALEANYNYEIAATHYNGASHRIASITTADRGSAQHLIALGLAYVY
jgi:Bacterial SH3 domain